MTYKSAEYSKHSEISIQQSSIHNSEITIQKSEIINQ